MNLIPLFNGIKQKAVINVVSQKNTLIITEQSNVCEAIQSVTQMCRHCMQIEPIFLGRVTHLELTKYNAIKLEVYSRQHL